MKHPKLILNAGFWSFAIAKKKTPNHRVFTFTFFSRLGPKGERTNLSNTIAGLDGDCGSVSFIDISCQKLPSLS